MVKSDVFEFRSMGHTAKVISGLVLVAVLAAGCGKKSDDFAKRAGETVGEKLTDFTKGVGKGVDQRMMVEVVLRPEVQALGLTNTVAKSLGLDATRKGISVYFIASQSFSNTLVARALNADGLEVGRAKKTVVLEKDDAAYVPFEFDADMDTATVRKYTIGL
jgi:hypothetical protein